MDGLNTVGLNLDKSEFHLRPIAEDDGDMVRDWRNQDHIRKNMYTDHIIAPKEHARWMEDVLADPRKAYAIFEHRQRAIGLVGFYDVSVEHGRAHWAFYLGVDDAVRGSGPAMELFALDHAFGDLGIRKLCCEVFAFNKAVIKLHRRFGFVEEGLRKRHHLKDGQREDIVELALFDDDWSSIRPAVHDSLFEPRPQSDPTCRARVAKIQCEI